MLTRWDPFTEMNRLHNELWRQSANGRAMGFRPAVDVHEDEEAITLRAELPGVKSEDVHVDVEDGVLTLRGERKLDREEDREGFHIQERAYGSFQRSFTLPNTVDFDKIDAQLREGVLHVRLPKTEQSKPRRIEVKGEA